MLLGASLQQSARALRSNRMRSALTILGVVIGIASVIALVSAGRAAQQQITTSVQANGADLLMVTPGGRRTGREGPPTGGGQASVTTLTEGDADAIATLASIGSVASEVSGQLKLQTLAYEQTVSVSGVSASYFTIRNADVDRGAPFLEEDDRAMARVAVIGPTLATNAFGDADPIGQTVRLGRFEFTVVGVTAAKGAAGFGGDPDSGVIVPLQTAQGLLFGRKYVQTIDAQAAASDLVEQAQEDITALLLDRHKIDDPAKADFTIRNSAEMLSTLETVTGSLTLFLAAIAAISLLVGGIGIMNIMLVAVTERTREIGLRKAIGAKRRDILLQFLIEAVALTLIGGIIGIALGMGIFYLITRFAGWTFQVQFDAIIVAVLVSMAFGLVFGIFPAAKASRLSPIDALRAE